MGHSQGGDIMFYGASERPDFFNEKVNLFIALGPTIYFKHVTNKMVKKAASLGYVVDIAARHYSLYEYQGSETD